MEFYTVIYPALFSKMIKSGHI